jgi:hypothetical protein
VFEIVTVVCALVCESAGARDTAGDAGESIGAISGRSMLYAAVATGVTVEPPRTAIARSVSVELTAIGPVYNVEAEVGALPSAV